MSIRKTIRDNIKATLLADTTVAALVGTDVTIGQDNVTESVLWPAIYIVPVRDETDTHTMSVSRQQMRSMTLTIEYWVKPSSDSTPVEDDIDTGADAIANATLADTTQGGSCADTLLTSIDYMIEGREDGRYGVGRVSFTTKYFTQES